MNVSMKTPTLSIVIPTYNREKELGFLLADIEKLLETDTGKIQVVVCDNNSTDASGVLLELFRRKWTTAIKLVSRSINLGMEGNIACAMIEGDGKYIWMLSDHQRLCVPAVRRSIELLQTLEFDIGHAKVMQWSSALDRREIVVPWGEIPSKQRGALLFSLGNLSTLIFRREVALTATKGIFRCCGWSYPHLGIISRINSSTRLVEFESMSILPESKSGSKLVHDYDKITVRYRSNLMCVNILSRTAGITFEREGFFTRDYRAAFRGDVLNFLQQSDVSRSLALRTLAPVIALNPWSLKLIAFFVLLGVLCVPKVVRINVASAARDWIISRRHKNTADQR
jgi:glycosyltransferase involved in cell wall biosynthesis